MKRTPWLALVALTVLGSPSLARAQAWDGIISPSRAIDWSQAGIPTGIPSGSWTQCGSTIAAYDGPADAISNQIGACGANQFVLLGPGTFTLSTSIDFQAKSHVVLRGSGADSTFLVFTGSSSQPSCNTGAAQLIGICGNKLDWWSSPPVYTWTAGMSQGSTSITLSDTAGIAPLSSGYPTLIILNQNDDGYTGYPPTGSALDNGGYFVCADLYATGPVRGCSYNGPDGTPPSPFAHRWQEELALGTAVDSAAGVVTLAHPIEHPNWRAEQSPTAMLFGPTVVSSGVEDLSIDMQGNQQIGYAINFSGAYQCWVRGVRVMNGYNWAIGALYSSHLQIESNYLYNGPGPDSYGIRFSHTGDNQIVNNIIQKIRAPIVFDNPDSGSVLAYNFTINDIFAGDAMFPAFWDHSAGDDFHLWEGNVGSGSAIDNCHGTHLDETTFRSFLTGWESCGNGQCGDQTLKDWGTGAVQYLGYNRFGNIIGNVVGTPGVTTVYQTDSFGGNNSAYYLGGGNPGIDPPMPPDPLTATTSLRWANWDAVTDATRFCGESSNTGWAAACSSTSEVPTTAPSYPNSLPTVGDTGAGQPPLPASLFLSGKPTWFGTIPFPPIGPDVTGGNIGQCTGAPNTAGQFAGLPATSDGQCNGAPLDPNAWAGHVNAIPAMACYLSLGGALDGTGEALAFNASACYAGVKCTSNAQCDDADVCTTDTCNLSAGTCQHALISGCCSSSAQCDDGNACTLDKCDTATHKCSSTPSCSGDGGVVDGGKTDGGPSTADSSADGDSGDQSGGGCGCVVGASCGHRGSTLLILLLFGGLHLRSGRRRLQS